MTDKGKLDYASLPKEVRFSPGATWTALILTLLLPVSYCLFAFLRHRQMAVSPPYDKPYLVWSVVCQLALPAIALGDLILIALCWRRIARPILVISLIFIGLVGAYIVWFVVALLQVAADLLHYAR